MWETGWSKNWPKLNFNSHINDKRKKVDQKLITFVYNYTIYYYSKETSFTKCLFHDAIQLPPFSVYVP